MTSVVSVNPPELGPAVGFSHASRAGNLVAVGGQVGCDASGAITHRGDIAAQFAVAIANLGRAIEAAGCRPADVIKICYYVTDVRAYRAASRQIGAAYRGVFGKHFPASVLLGVAALYDLDAMIEIDCWAVAPEVTT
jgi:enamine deaminase RidA (YjgF/YER057c/UK114 family)